MGMVNPRAEAHEVLQEAFHVAPSEFASQTNMDMSDLNDRSQQLSDTHESQIKMKKHSSWKIQQQHGGSLQSTQIQQQLLRSGTENFSTDEGKKDLTKVSSDQNPCSKCSGNPVCKCPQNSGITREA